MKYEIIENRNFEKLFKEFIEFAENYLVINQTFKYHPEISLYTVEIKYIEKDLWRKRFS